MLCESAYHDYYELAIEVRYKHMRTRCGAFSLYLAHIWFVLAGQQSLPIHLPLFPFPFFPFPLKITRVRAQGPEAVAARDARGSLRGGRPPRPDDAVPALRKRRRTGRPGLPPPQRRLDRPGKPHGGPGYLHPRGNDPSREDHSGGGACGGDGDQRRRMFFQRR